MKLYNKLTKTKRHLFDQYLKHLINDECSHLVNIDDIQSLDDFLADQGFEINPTAFGPQWIYRYENGDEVVIDYATCAEKWSLYFEGHDPNLISTEERFNSIDELINYLQGVITWN